jgi:hypothetical protein
MIRIITIILILIFLSACSDLPEQLLISGNPAPPETAGFPVETNPDIPETETYQTYTFSESDIAFLDTCFFIGDGIFANLTDSGLLKAEQVFADDNATTLNITEIRSPHNDGETYLLTALVNSNPENVIILLGMNDIKVLAADEFSALYTDFITFIRIYCPASVITVLSIPPVHRESQSLNNTLITEYNEALRTAVREMQGENIRFLDLGAELKTSHGRLKSRFAQEDNTNLTTQGLYAVLWTLCNHLQ